MISATICYETFVGAYIACEPSALMQRPITWIPAFRDCRFTRKLCCRLSDPDPENVRTGGRSSVCAVTIDVNGQGGGADGPSAEGFGTSAVGLRSAEPQAGAASSTSDGPHTVYDSLAGGDPRGIRYQADGNR